MHNLPEPTAQPYIHRRGRPLVLLLTTIVALLIASAPVTAPAIKAWAHNEKTSALKYEQQYGHWDVVNLPADFRLNTVHAALLPTGKILMVAGSGNNRSNFDSYHNDGQIAVLKTGVYDPVTGSMKIVPTPADFFCGGQAMLQSGNLLVAGGTSGYEVLKGDVKNPAGTMTLHNENPDGPARIFKKGTKFVGPTGKVYASTQDVTLEPAMKMGEGLNTMVMHSSTKVFVEAVAADKSYIAKADLHYTIAGLRGDDARNIYGQGGAMTLDKQDFRGDNQSYEFNPYTEEYVKVGDLHESRWYPTLPVLTNGQVLAVSGLDNTGQITDTTERYDPSTKQWTMGPNIALPTYPALFRTADPDVLFYSGSNAGYGPADVGRVPGFWNIVSNSFKPVSGLTQMNILETSGSVALPPIQGSNDGSQDARILLAGGGGVGESKLVTARTAIINLADAAPKYTAGPDLPAAVRYVNLTVTPWDEVIAAGGSSDYRGKENSYSYKTVSYNPTTGALTPLADELIGRSYHSGSLLLPDGRILFFGNDPLYSDKDNTAPGVFEQRFEIFTPPQLYRGARPSLIGKAAQEVHRGQQLTFDSTDPAAIKTARLIPPSSTTHVTNIEQRSVGAIVKTVGGKVEVDLPNDQNLLPDGWYMLFVMSAAGTPSQSISVHVTS